MTEKHLEYDNISYQYMDTAMRRVEERFSPEEIAALEKIFAVTTAELMPKVKAC